LLRQVVHSPTVAATRYDRVRIAAWSAVSPAGDAARTWSALESGHPHLELDTVVGWVGRCHAGDQDALGFAVSEQVSPALPAGRCAVGLGTSKGSLAAAIAGAPGFTRHWPGALSDRIAVSLDRGPCIPCACAAACSTGLACMLAGADLVERGHADAALVGAAEASLSPFVLAGFANAGVLCGGVPPQAFAKPTGFAPAEGAAAFVLGASGPWRLVAGVRLGDASHETHFLDPATLTTALRDLWELAPQPDLIVCHATGTAAGDRYERAGLEDGPWRSAQRALFKPVIGHALGASGAVELAAALHSPARRLWKLSLGFGGHLVAVACER
jgi:hypothetical protein